MPSFLILISYFLILNSHTVPLPDTLKVCEEHLFDSRQALEAAHYRPVTVERVLRIRHLYVWYIENPDTKDRQFVDEDMQRFEVSRSEAYSDLSIVKALLPHLSQASRDFHRWRVNEMLLETFNMAKKRKDTRTMEKAASSLGKLNRVDLEDETAMPFELIVVQPFCATMDPTVLGIEPIPALDKVIDNLIEKYAADTLDVYDVTWEEADLEENLLFPDIQEAEFVEADGEETSVL